MESYWKVGLNAFSVLSAYRTTVTPDAAGVGNTAIDAEYPHKLFGVLRHTETTKLKANEEIQFKAVVPAGRYLVQTENHDVLSGPLLSFFLQVVRCSEEGEPLDGVVFEDSCERIGSKASPVNDSFHESRFEVPGGCHGLLFLSVKNTGSWRGCKGSILLRGSTDLYRLIDTRSTASTDKKVAEMRMQWFDRVCASRLLLGETCRGLVHPVLHIQGRRKVIGTLFATNYQLLFVPNVSPSAASAPSTPSASITPVHSHTHIASSGSSTGIASLTPAPASASSSAADSKPLFPPSSPQPPTSPAPAQSDTSLLVAPAFVTIASSLDTAMSDGRRWTLPVAHIAKIDWTDTGEGGFACKLHCRSLAVAKIRTMPIAPAQTLIVDGPEKDFRSLLHSLAFPSSPSQPLFAFVHGALRLNSHHQLVLAPSSPSPAGSKDPEELVDQKERKDDVLLQPFSSLTIGTEEDEALPGWKLYDAVQEYARLGIYPSSEWRLTELNKNYELCDTYPRTLAVPQCVTDDQLRAIAQFRSRGRIPVVVWRHPQKSAVLLRCSQPRTGLFGKGSPEDEFFMQAVRTLNTQNSALLYIFDARPIVNAMTNTLMGKGYEDISAYQNCKLKFLDIDNIQVMSASLKRLRDTCYKDPSMFSLKEALSCDWLVHVERILTGTAEVVRTIEETSASVVIHCSDGWDRTAQLVALTELCLDSYFRSMRGFAVLIEKEWLSFGHQFSKRTGLGERFENEGYWESFTGEKGPIFLQFIDCVYQVLMTYPTAFEFNHHFLLMILHHLYSCRYGTFLMNSERERFESAIPYRSHSLWSVLDDSHMAKAFQNTAYDSSMSTLHIGSIKPLLWTAYYLPSNVHSNIE